MKHLLSVCVVIVGLGACAQSDDPMSESVAARDVKGGTSSTDLGTLGGASAMATDINIQGTVVGWSETASGQDHAFRWSARSGMIDLGTLPGHQWSRAVSITSSGQVLGESGPTGGKGTPVVWTSFGTRSVLPIPFAAGGYYREIADMNERGQVVGSANSGSSSFPHAWSWDRMFGFLDLNTRIPGGFENYASRVNNWGQVVGTNNANDAFNNYHAYTWSRFRGFRDLGVPAGADLRRTSLNGFGGNDLGQVVGSIHGPTAGSGVFTWSSSGGFRILDGWNDDVDGAGTGLNLLGLAVGNAWDGQRLIPAAWPASGGIVALSPNQSGIAMAVNDLGSVVGWVTPDETSGVTRAMLWKVSGSPFLATTADIQAVATGTPGAMPPCFTEPASMRSRSSLINCMAGT
jgi:probable HAF family extracellular repeat protein